MPAHTARTYARSNIYTPYQLRSARALQLGLGNFIHSTSCSYTKATLRRGRSYLRREKGRSGMARVEARERTHYAVGSSRKIRSDSLILDLAV